MNRYIKFYFGRKLKIFNKNLILRANFIFFIYIYFFFILYPIPKIRKIYLKNYENVGIIFLLFFPLYDKDMKLQNQSFSSLK